MKAPFLSPDRVSFPRQIEAIVNENNPSRWADGLNGEVKRTLPRLTSAGGLV